MSMQEVNEIVTAWWPVAVGVYTFGGGIVTLYTRSIHNRMKDLQDANKATADRAEQNAKDLAAHKLHVAETYSTASETATLFGQLLETLRRIEDKLERKADK